MLVLPNVDTIGSVVLEKNVLTHDERQQMPTIAISHLSDSGDLKRLFIEGNENRRPTVLKGRLNIRDSTLKDLLLEGLISTSHLLYN